MTDIPTSPSPSVWLDLDPSRMNQLSLVSSSGLAGLTSVLWECARPGQGVFGLYSVL